MLSKFFDKYNISQKKLYFSLLVILTIFFFCKNIDIGIMLFISVLFACALNPLVDALEKKMNRPLASTLVLLGFIVLVSIFILPILYLSVYEIMTFAQEFPQYIDNIEKLVSGMPVLKTIWLSKINTASIADSLSNSSTVIFESVLNFASGTSAALLYIFTSLVILFFLLVDKVQVKDSIIKLFPSEYRDKASNIISTVSEKLSGYIFAQTVVSGSVWVIMTIGLLIFKINYAVLLGIIAGILSIIPIVGSGISLIICLIATFDMGIKYLTIVVVLYTFSHFIENHVVRPYVYSKFLNLHQILIFLALFIGAKYQGVLGVILAPPFVMALYILFEELYIKKMDE